MHLSIVHLFESSRQLACRPITIDRTRFSCSVGFYCTGHWLLAYADRSTRSSWVACSSPSVCLCGWHNSTTNDTKVFKFGIGKSYGFWTWCLGWKVKGHMHFHTNDCNSKTTDLKTEYSEWWPWISYKPYDFLVERSKLKVMVRVNSITAWV